MFFMHLDGKDGLINCKEQNVTINIVKITMHNELKGGAHKSIVNR